MLFTPGFMSLEARQTRYPETKSHRAFYSLYSKRKSGQKGVKLAKATAQRGKKQPRQPK